MTRASYTLEFKQEAVRLVKDGQSIAAVSRTLGVVDQTLFSWVKAHKQGLLKGALLAKPVSNSVILVLVFHKLNLKLTFSCQF